MKRLYEYRIKNNLTYQQMANILGISKTYYWQIENEKRGLSYKMSLKIAEVFKLKPDDLFYEHFKVNNEKEK